MTNKNKSFFKLSKIIIITMCFLMVLSGCDNTKNINSDKDDNSVGIVTKDLNPELQDVVAYAAWGKSLAGEPNNSIVAIKANGEFVELLKIRPKISSSVYLTFAYNCLFFVLEESDCIGYINLGEGDGNYHFTSLVDGLAADRVFGIAVAGNKLFYSYRNEIEGINSVKVINLSTGKPEADLINENLVSYSGYHLNNYDESRIVVSSVDYGLRILNVENEPTTEYEDYWRVIFYCGFGRILFDADDIDEFDNDEKKPITVIEYSKDYSQPFREMKLYFGFWDEDMPIVIPYRDGYIYNKLESGKVYLNNGKKNKLLPIYAQTKISYIDNITLIARDVIEIRDANYSKDIVYQYNLVTKKWKKQLSWHYFYDVFYMY